MNKSEVMACDNCFTLTPKQLQQMLEGDSKGQFVFGNMSESPSEALLLHYLNSGLFGFSRWREYNCEYARKIMDKKVRTELCKEILDEKLSDKELKQILERFFKCHSYLEDRLPSCGCCGI
jgi:hypothetical protein